MIYPRVIEFHGWKCDVSIEHRGGAVGTIIEFKDHEDDMLVTRATLTRKSIEAMGIELEDDDIAIKNYSQNQGMLDLLVREKITTPAHRIVKAGNVDVPIVKLTADVKHVMTH